MTLITADRAILLVSLILLGGIAPLTVPTASGAGPLTPLRRLAATLATILALTGLVWRVDTGQGPGAPVIITITACLILAAATLIPARAKGPRTRTVAGPDGERPGRDREGGRDRCRHE
ncbi:hypothetical protein [Bifidobacterium simiarum]|uniref:hypothetical protein n=1 Tax=Bifidobacterium simiarum TaxID=2045441 RepID=UPI001BDCCE83|nr:hypothetical protein [Bifidobacterium simiarum]MBT1167268.1 hypothetical protein [Bifidobacterium simiarum]